MTFEHFAIGVGITLLLLMIPAMLRIVNGPTALDRIVAVNVIGTKTAVLLVVIGVVFGAMRMALALVPWVALRVPGKPVAALGALEGAGLAFRASFTSPSLAGQMAALRAGLGVGFLPAAMAPRDLTVLGAPLPPLSDSEIALVSTRGMGGPAGLLAQEVLRALERGPMSS